MKDIFFEGTFVEFDYESDGIVTSEVYILAEYHDSENAFQIICVSGYHAGCLSGYVRKDMKIEKQNKRAVSQSHLINELKRNFLLDENSLKIYTESPIQYSKRKSK